MHFKMSSANCFNLDQSKILSSGNGLRLYVLFSAVGKHFPEHGQLGDLYAASLLVL